MADAEPFPILDRLRRGRFIITAEQANPAQMKRYNSLTRRGVIDAVTLPDLPLVAQFRDIRSALSGSAPSTDPLDSIEGTRQPIATISSTDGVCTTREPPSCLYSCQVEKFHPQPVGYPANAAFGEKNVLFQVWRPLTFASVAGQQPASNV